MKRAQLIWWGTLGLLGLAILCGAFALLGLFESGANISETMLVANNVNGAAFEVIYTNSDTLAKQEWVNVYVFDSGSWSNWLSRLIHPRKLLLSYDPGYPAEVPRIESAGPDKIRISISRISSVSYQSRRWKHLSVNYQIGRIDFR